MDYSPTNTTLVVTLREQIASLEDQLRAAREKIAWQPIATLSMELDALVLIWPTGRGSNAMAIHPATLQHAMRRDTPEHLQLHPTHWMPLPEPPK